jgi:hypothetical protein
VRWIVFNDDTAEAVVTRLRRGAAEIQHSDPVDAALNSAWPSLVILPSRVAGRLLVAQFTVRESARTVSTDPKPSITPPKRPPVSKKSWWNKLIA